MPRYFFNAKDANEFEDKDGVELPDIVAAKEEAVAHFGETLRSHARSFHGDEEWEMSIADQSGLILLAFTFSMREAPAIRSSSLSTRSAASISAKLTRD